VFVVKEICVIQVWAFNGSSRSFRDCAKLFQSGFSLTTRQPLKAFPQSFGHDSGHGFSGFPGYASRETMGLRILDIEGGHAAILTSRVSSDRIHRLRETRRFRPNYLQERTSGAKGHDDYITFTPGINPRPSSFYIFKGDEDDISTREAALEAVFWLCIMARLKSCPWSLYILSTVFVAD
jgi:hypothetical protein